MSSTLLSGYEEEWNDAPMEPPDKSAQIPSGTYQARVHSVESFDTKDDYPVVKILLQVVGGTYTNAIVHQMHFLKDTDSVGRLKQAAARLGIECKLNELEDKLTELSNAGTLFEIEVKYVDSKDGNKVFQNIYVNKILGASGASYSKPADENKVFDY